MTAFAHRPATRSAAPRAGLVRAAALAALIVTGAAAGPVWAQERVAPPANATMAYAAVPGLSLRYVFSAASSGTVEQTAGAFDGAPLISRDDFSVSNLSTEVRLRQDAAADAAADAAFSLVPVKLRKDYSVNGEKFSYEYEYNRHAATLNGQATDSVRVPPSDLEAVFGKAQGTLKLSRTGAVTSRVAAPVRAESMRAVYNDFDIAAPFVLMFPNVPTEAAKVGDAWESTRTIPDAGLLPASPVMTIRNVVREIREVQGETFVRIETSGRWSIDTAADRDEFARPNAVGLQPSRYLIELATSTAWFNATRGHVHAVEFKVSHSGLLARPDGESGATTRVTIGATYTLKLTEAVRQLWRVPMNVSTHARPLVAGDAVYAGSVGVRRGQGTATMREGGEAYAIERATGKVLWRFDQQSEGADHGFTGDPVAVGDNIVFTGRNGSLYAVNKTSGTRAWTYTPKGASATTEGGAALGGDTLYYTTAAGELHAVNGLTGAAAWEKPARLTAARDRNPSPARGIVAVDDARVYAGSTDKNIYAFDRASGALIADEAAGAWAVDSGSSLTTGLTLSGTAVYASMGDRRIRGWNTKTREQLWPQGSADLGVSLTVRPAVDGGFVYIGTTTQKLIALDGEGREAWSVALKSIAGTPVFAGDYVYTLGGRALSIVKRTRTETREGEKVAVTEKGALVHTVDLDERVDGTPTGVAVARDGKVETVYVPNGPGLTALTWYLPPTLK